MFFNIYQWITISLFRFLDLFSIIYDFSTWFNCLIFSVLQEGIKKTIDSYSYLRVEHQSKRKRTSQASIHIFLGTKEVWIIQFHLSQSCCDLYALLRSLYYGSLDWFRFLVWFNFICFDLFSSINLKLHVNFK